MTQRNLYLVKSRKIINRINERFRAFRPPCLDGLKRGLML